VEQGVQSNRLAAAEACGAGQQVALLSRSGYCGSYWRLLFVSPPAEPSNTTPKHKLGCQLPAATNTWSAFDMFGLYSAQITELDVALQTGIDIGDSCVQGRVEIYSCIEAIPPLPLYTTTISQVVPFYMMEACVHVCCL